MGDDGEFVDVDGLTGNCPECGKYIHYWNPRSYPAQTVCDECDTLIEVDMTAETYGTDDVETVRELAEETVQNFVSGSASQDRCDGQDSPNPADVDDGATMDHASVCMQAEIVKQIGDDGALNEHTVRSIFRREAIDAGIYE